MARPLALYNKKCLWIQWKSKTVVKCCCAGGDLDGSDSSPLNYRSNKKSQSIRMNCWTILFLFLKCQLSVDLSISQRVLVLANWQSSDEWLLRIECSYYLFHNHSFDRICVKISQNHPLEIMFLMIRSTRDQSINCTENFMITK